MRRRSALGLLALLVLAGILSASLATHDAAGGSAMSHGPGGLFAARKYLEARGAEVRLLDRPLDARVDPDPGLLVLAFPWQRVDRGEHLSGVGHYLRRGGVVLLAYSGDRIDPGEAQAFESLSLRSRSLRGEAPLDPLRWRRFVTEEWSLAPEPGEARRRLRLRAPSRVPEASAAAQVLFRGADGTPLAFREARGRGQLVVVPADALSNARLDQEGNADLLESLAQAFGPRWSFDEYHHGLTPPAAPGEARRQGVVDLLLAHLALLYALAVLAVARRFGPAWEEAPVTSGSAASLLLALGGLHQRLGHHAHAAARIVARARELQPRLRLPDGLGRDVRDARGLLDVARRVARAQAGRGGTDEGR
jgi:hypothetical protein